MKMTDYIKNRKRINKTLFPEFEFKGMEINKKTSEELAVYKAPIAPVKIFKIPAMPKKGA